MAKGDLTRMHGSAEPDTAGAQGDPATTVVDKARSETVQRLQVGLSGLAAMILLVGLANIIQDRARGVDELAVPEAAPTVTPDAPPPLTDPLADAGVVPDMPAEASPTQSAAIVPEQGNGAGQPTP